MEKEKQTNNKYRKGKICPRCLGAGLIPIDMNRDGRCYRCRGKGRLIH